VTGWPSPLFTNYRMSLHFIVFHWLLTYLLTYSLIRTIDMVFIMSKVGHFGEG
jgi:hypothetical protein